MSINWTVFDIETGPLPQDQLANLMPEFEAPANLKDPLKIEAAILAKRQAWIDNAALDPLSGRVLLFSWCDSTGYVGHHDEDDERHLIECAFRLLTAGKIIGFNSKKFDIPFLIRRAYILGANISWSLREYLTQRYSDTNVDLLDVWLCGDREFRGQSLGQICKACRIGEKLGDGADFHKLWTTDRQAAMAYAKRDIELTVGLAKRMGVIQ